MPGVSVSGRVISGTRCAMPAYRVDSESKAGKVAMTGADIAKLGEKLRQFIACRKADGIGVLKRILLCWLAERGLVSPPPSAMPGNAGLSSDISVHGFCPVTL